jgi:coenzyme F420-dependent glucose-6-phosphate dehydrogenase
MDTVRFGYTLSSEEHPPHVLVENARKAEAGGFDFVSISDHLHPWTQAQGHSPFVWTVLGALAQATDRIGVGVGVTCPIMRIHPVVLAQATATTSLLLGDRFFWGVGTGEALNEHAIGRRWPPPEVRLEMLEEALDVIRSLWSGETVDYRGTHFEVDNARLFDAPSTPIPIIVSGFGEAAARVAARIGDGYWGNAPDRALLDTFADAGGHGPRYAQLRVCWADNAEQAQQTVHDVWPTAGLSGQLSQDLPTWTHFEQATAPLTVEQVVANTPCGPDIASEIADTVRKYRDAGYDHLYFHQVGPDQDGFLRYWERELAPALQPATAGAR